MAAKYQTADYAAFDMDDSAGLTKLGKSLATAVGTPKKYVPGFLVASMRMLHKSGNATPLIAFMQAADLKTEQLAARYIGALSGIDNNGKPRVQWRKSDSRFNWGTWRVDGSINEIVAAILSDAHGKMQFDAPTLVKAVFPKREKATDYKKQVERAEKAILKVIEESNDVPVADIRAMLKKLDALLIEKAHATAQPTVIADDVEMETAVPSVQAA